MRKASIFVSLIALLATGLMAQDDLAQYQTWMKAGAGASRALRGAITAKDSAAIAAQSKTMAESFDQIAQFWAKRHKDDAQKMAETARDAAKAAGTAATPEEQTAALQKANPTCQGCHSVYRDGDKIKE